MPLMGQREYARHRQCALRAVQKAIEAGRIKTVLDAAGRAKIDSEQADRDWVHNTDPAKQSLLHGAGPSAASASLPAAGSEDEAESLESSGAADDNAAYRQARGEREQLRLQRDRYELEQLRGSLISVDEAKRLAFTAFRSLRDAVLNVPARVKDQCAAETDALRIEQLLDAELSAALGGFNADQVLSEIDDEDDDDEQ